MKQRSCKSCGKSILLRQRRCNYCGISQDTSPIAHHRTDNRKSTLPSACLDPQTDTPKTESVLLNQSKKTNEGSFYRISRIRLGLLPAFLIGILIAIGVMVLSEEAKLQSNVLTTGQVDQDGYFSVPLTHDGGVLMLDSVINNSSHVEFVVDSGAGDLFIPEQIMRDLKNEGVVTESDYVGTGKYILADGRIVESPQYNIKTVMVGGLTVLNVLSSVSPEDSPPLLGQSFLKKFKSWRIDNARNRLYLQVSE